MHYFAKLHPFHTILLFCCRGQIRSSAQTFFICALEHHNIDIHIQDILFEVKLVREEGKGGRGGRRLMVEENN